MRVEMSRMTRQANARAHAPVSPDAELDRIVFAVAAFSFLVHVWFAHGYGWFRDEFYYLACARHLAWGYVDHPPLSIAILAAWVKLFGDALLVVRLVPAVAGAAVVVFTGMLAREMGGRAVAQTTAAIAACVCPEYLALEHFYSMNALDLVAWAAAAWALARIVATDAPRRGEWVTLGVILGLGLENKMSVLWIGFGFAVGLVATPQRKLLKTSGPWLAFALALALFAPHVIWQFANGFPTREFMKNASADKMAATLPLAFLRAQIEDIGPLAAPLWIGGLAALLFDRALARWRALGVAYLAVLAILLANRTSRTEYLAPAYPMLFAAGAVALERVTRTRAWTAIAYASMIALGGALTSPLALPVLSPSTYIAYAKKLGAAPVTEEKKDVGPLPQFYADMFGWKELADGAAHALDTLTPEERANAVIIAGNYGEAGAIERLGRNRIDVPVVSGHNNYWLWGPGHPDARVAVVVRNRRDGLDERCGHVDLVTITDHSLAMPYERHLGMYVCRDMKQPLGALWPMLKHYD
jgi:hypothetical protein